MYDLSKQLYNPIQVNPQIVTPIIPNVVVPTLIRNNLPVIVTSIITNANAGLMRSIPRLLLFNLLYENQFLNQTMMDLTIMSCKVIAFDAIQSNGNFNDYNFIDRCVNKAITFWIYKTLYQDQNLQQAVYRVAPNELQNINTYLTQLQQIEGAALQCFDRIEQMVQRQPMQNMMQNNGFMQPQNMGGNVYGNNFNGGGNTYFQNNPAVNNGFQNNPGGVNFNMNGNQQSNVGTKWENKPDTSFTDNAVTVSLTPTGRFLQEQQSNQQNKPFEQSSTIFEKFTAPANKEINTEFVSEDEWVPTDTQPYKTLTCKLTHKSLFKRMVLDNEVVVFEKIERLNEMDRSKHVTRSTLTGKEISEHRIQYLLDGVNNLKTASVFTVSNEEEADKEKEVYESEHAIVINDYVSTGFTCSLSLESAFVKARAALASIPSVNVYLYKALIAEPFFMEDKMYKLLSKLNACRTFSKMHIVLKDEIEELQQLKDKASDNYILDAEMFIQAIDAYLTEIINEFIKIRISYDGHIDSFIGDMYDFKKSVEEIDPAYGKYYTQFEKDLLLNNIFAPDEIIEEVNQEILVSDSISSDNVTYLTKFANIVAIDITYPELGIDIKPGNPYLVSSDVPWLYEIIDSLFSSVGKIQPINNYVITKDNVKLKIVKGSIIPKAYLVIKV